MANNFATTAGDGSGKDFVSFQSAGGIDLPGGGVVFLTDTTDGASTWSVPLAAALADNTANPTTILHGSCGMVFNGSNWDRMPGTSADGVLVNLGGNNDVTLAVLPDTAGGALAALVVDAAAIEALLATIDTDTGGIATSTASIDGKITACNTGAVVVSSSALPSGAATSANQSTMITALQLIDDAIYTHESGTTSKGVLVMGKTGTTPYCWTVDSSGNGMVRSLSHANLPCSADLYQGEAQVGASNGVYVRPQASQTWPSAGTIAHDTADSGNPVKVGARAAATLSDDTMVADADRTDAVADLDGAIIVRPGVPLGDILSERVTNTDGVSTASTVFGATASTRNCITAIVLHNASATDGYVDFRDGTAGAVLFTVPIPAGGGAIVGNGAVPLFRTTANTALAFDVSAALTTVYISLSGFKSKV